MLKFYALGLLLCFGALASHAQFEKGQKLIGGNVGFSINNNKNENAQLYTADYASVFVNPTFATFYKTNMLKGVGLTYGYNFQRLKNLDDKEVNNSRTHTVGLNVYVQRFKPLVKKLYFTINTGGSAQYQFGKIINTSLPANTKNKAGTKGYSITLNLAPGLSYQLTNRLLFDAYLSNLVSIQYAHAQTEYTDPLLTSKSNSFNLSSSLTNTNLGYVGLGFRWLLQK